MVGPTAPQLRTSLVGTVAAVAPPAGVSPAAPHLRTPSPGPSARWWLPPGGHDLHYRPTLFGLAAFAVGLCLATLGFWVASNVPERSIGPEQVQVTVSNDSWASLPCMIVATALRTDSGALSAHSGRHPERYLSVTQGGNS